VNFDPHISQFVAAKLCKLLKNSSTMFNVKDAFISKTKKLKKFYELQQDQKIQKTFIDAC